MIEYNREDTKQKWTVMKYMKDFDLMMIYSYALRENAEISDEGISNMLEKMKQDGKYSPRAEISVDTGKFKIIQIAWYMFGFYEKKRNREKKFVFSPLGNLLLDNIDNPENVSKIFLTMLIGNPFRQPYSKMTASFNIFPFRLLFSLMTDKRIECKLYNDEVFYLVMFVKKCDTPTYESLLFDILELRKMNPKDKYIIFKHNESVLANAIHEWGYASKLMEGAGILEISEGHKVGSLIQGNNTGIRSYRTDSVNIHPDLVDFAVKMLKKYTFDELPYPDEQEAQGKFIDDVIMSFYSFYPKELLEELGMYLEDENQGLLDIISSINQYSRNENFGDFNLFEDSLENSFNLFTDINARKISGSGEPDIVCIFKMSDTLMKNFTLEAKSTKNKLIEVHSSRLRQHRERHSLKYTIVVTPDFTPACVRDIKHEPITIVKAAVLTNFLYQSIKKYGRNLSYHQLDSLVEESLGKDLTHKMSSYIYENFGVPY